MDSPVQDSLNEGGNDSQGSSDNEKPCSQPPRRTYSTRWTAIVKQLHKPILKFLHFITLRAATNPKKTVVSVTVVSSLLVVTGLLTNFNTEYDEEVAWTPRDSLTLEYKTWIDKESGFPAPPRPFSMLFHFDGENVLGQKQVQRMFNALDDIRGLEGYDDMCAESDYEDDEGNRTTCEIYGAVRFWNSTTEIFQASISTDEQAIAEMSKMNFPDGFPVVENKIFGFPQRDDADKLTNALSYGLFILFPDTSRAEAFEEKALDVIISLDNSWRSQSDSVLYVEVYAKRSFPDEFMRAIIVDIPLRKLAANEYFRNVAVALTSLLSLSFIKFQLCSS
jgi:hypothetical protein